MPEFLRLLPPAEALQILLGALPNCSILSETIETAHSLNRVTATDVCAPYALPEFPRSTMDGYALRARETYGVSESMPGYLSLKGEVPMGGKPLFSIKPGECALIHTGGMVPMGADAVIMLENTQRINKPCKDPQANLLMTEIEIARAIIAGENILQVGEDVTAGQIVLKGGKRIRPADIGVCMALGIIKIRVANRPTIGIISSGDEVVPPNQITRLGQVRDINSYSLGALIEEEGGIPLQFGIVSDDLEKMKIMLTRALTESEVVIITAGSSASARDMTAAAIASIGEPGVLVHGVNVRPGKPTILAVCNGKPVIGLPGNPVSALVIAGLILVPIIEKFLGTKPRHKDRLLAKLTLNVPSLAGREDWIPVKITENGGKGENEIKFLAEPVFTKSNLIFSFAIADGLVCIPPDATGISAGEKVEVVLI
jgi:molybdopterin molybdotransferase